MDKRRMITGLVDMAALACKAEGMWGVLCSWAPDDDSDVIQHIRSCLPNCDFPTDSSLPQDGWFLRLIPTEAMARVYYNQCRGDDAGVHDGVYAVLINFQGKVVTENT